MIVIWRLIGQRGRSDAAEDRMHKLVVVSIVLLAPYIAQDVIRTLIAPWA